ncbi:MAG: C25 family cysteine peptidase [Candidatus Kapaibacterium sp.]
MKKHLRTASAMLLFLFLPVFVFANAISFNSTGKGINVNILESRLGYTKIEYTFNGYEQKEIIINGKTYVYLTAPDMTSFMEKGSPDLLTYKRSLLIPDNAGMNYRILSRDVEELSTLPVMPSKGHFTRDIDPNSVPYTFGNVYTTDKYYPENIISLDAPYIVRDFRGMTVQFNPLQYNPVKGKMLVTKRMIVEFFTDNSKQVVNPFLRLKSLGKVSNEFSALYYDLFMNYGIGSTRFDSIPEPGKMLVICPTAYMSAIQPFVQWKQSRGLNVTVAEYPTATGTGNTAIKTYIQNMYNSAGSVTYIVLVGESTDIPTLSGQYESAPSDPCYVKLSGTDAYPDAFISRMSCGNAASVSYVVQKAIRFERDIQFGAAWYNKGTGIGGPDNGGTPSYTDSVRMNWVRDTLMLGGFTHVDKVNGPVATPQSLITVLNDGRYVLNYVGHGSGTSWSNTGFAVSNAYQLANGWKQPYLFDVACLNGNFTLGECLAEALLRAGDTANPKGCVGIYASSTNASWVPPCDMQLFSNHLMSRQHRKTAGAMSFFGVMYAMDKWGGSTGEGLKLMEQYNIFGDCSLLLTRGVPLGPAISHNPLPNTENMAGPYVVNASINTINSGLVTGRTKLFWTRAAAFDSVAMTNSGGINWTANIPGNGSAALYKYYISTIDSMGRTSVSPGGAPTNYFSFNAATDIINPIITHTALSNVPKLNWPASIAASVTDNIGVDSVWVGWYKNNINTGYKKFKLLYTSGSDYAAAFNSVNADISIGDSIFYRVIACDISSGHNTDSTVQHKFKIINEANITIGTGTTSSNFPFTTYWKDGRTQYLYLASEINAPSALIKQIGFDVLSVGGPVMTGFTVSLQNTTAATLTGFVNTGWTVAYNPPSYAPSATGWNMIAMTTPFNYTGGNLLVDICFNNTTYTSYSTVKCTTAPGMYWGRYNDLTEPNGGCGYTAWTLTTGPVGRANTRFVLEPLTGVNPVSSQVPNVYSLSQNYPNPFNPATKINFAIPKQGLVTLKIYDVLGREVRTLVNEVKSAGNYTVDFNASEYSSGVYFYKLESNSFSDIKKMMLIK